MYAQSNERLVSLRNVLAPRAGGVAVHPSAMGSLLGSQGEVLGILTLSVGELCFGRSAGCHVL